MNPQIFKPALVASMLLASVAANAAKPLGIFDRRPESDPSIKTHRDVMVTIKHNKPVSIKFKTRYLPSNVVKHMNVKKQVVVRMGGAQ